MSVFDSAGELRPRVRDRLRLPRLSGRVSAGMLILCFFVTGLLIPMSLHLAPWIEIEIVLGTWWVIWFLVLSYLLAAGQRVTHDYEMHEPRSWLPKWSKKPATPPAEKPRRQSGWGDFWLWTGPADFEGCAVVLGIVVALVVLFAAVWFVVELALPAITFLAYFLVRGMLARVINDRHHCRGRLMKAAIWGACWATVYIGPLALAVWFVHLAARRQ